MGRVNVVEPDGRVVSVDESVVSNAAAAGNDVPLAGPGAEGELAAERARHEKYGGVLGGIASTVAGGLDTLTLGGYGKAVTALGGGEAYRGATQEHPGLYEAGAVGSLLVPGLGEAGLGARAGRAAGRAAEALGAGKGAARVVEGAAYGAGGAWARANISGDPVSIEALVEGAGIGGVLNYGAGVIGDKFAGAGRAAKAEQQLAERADYAEKLFSEPSPAYDGMVSARQDAIDAANTTNTEVRRQRAAMDKFTSSTKAFEGVQKGFGRSLDEIYARFVVGKGREAVGLDSAEAADIITRGSRDIARAARLHVAGETEEALNVLRPLRDEINAKIDVAVPDLPEIPGKPMNVPPPLPPTLDKFAHLRADTVAAIANGSTGAEGEAVARLAQELGVAPNIGPGATLADIQTALADHASALSEMSDLVGSETTPPFIRALKWAARKSAKAYVGGVVGSLFGPGGKLVGEMLGFTSGDIAASAVMEAKAGLRAKIRDIVANIGEPVGAAQRKLGPVSAWLTTSFPSGKRDPETDLGELAKNRARELQAATVTAPDMSYSAVAPLSGLPGNIGLKAHQQVLNALGHTAANAPRDPGLAPHGYGSDWKPSADEAIALAYRLEAMSAPLASIQRALAGEVHPAQVDALRANWPATLGTVMDELIGTDISKLSVDRLSGISGLSGSPRFGLDDPRATLPLQGMYLPKPQEQPKPSRGTGGPNGRPPATGRTQVAGSNVNLLTQ